MPKSRIKKSFSLLLVGLIFLMTIPTQVLAADTNGESRLARVDFSVPIELSPAFSPDTYTYSATVSNSVSSLTLTPYALDGAVTIRVNGYEVINGSVSRPIELSVGSNIITVVVQSLRNSNSVKNYVFTINRQHEINNADLKSLVVENAEIDQPFKTETTYYTGRVIPSRSYVVIRATAHEYSNIKVNDTSIGSSGHLLVDLNNGSNTINIVVTALGGATKTYTVVIYRPAPSTNANLKSIVINGKTYIEEKTYVGFVHANARAVDVQINAEDSYSTILLDGQKVNSGETVNLYLRDGASLYFPIQVTASDGNTTKSYHLYIVRQAADTGYSNGNDNGSTTIEGVLTVDASGAIKVTEGKGGTGIVEKNGNVRTLKVTLSTDSIIKTINENEKAKKLVIDYSNLVSLNDKLMVTIDGSLTKILQSKNVPVQLIGSIGSMTVDLTKVNGWNNGGTLRIGRDDQVATFHKDFIPESNFIEYYHSGSAKPLANPLDIEINVFTDTELRLANVYRYDGNSFEMVMSSTGNKSKKASGVRSGHYIVMSFKKTFTDIQNHWSYTLLDFLAKKQIIVGYPDDTFQPDRYITRAEFTSMLMNAIGHRLSIAQNSEEPFEDVNKNDWFYEAVNAGWKSGLITGVSETKFMPDETLTREQLAAISVRALKQIKGLSYVSNSQAESILGKYRDAAEVSPWSRIELATAIQNKIIEGVGQNTLSSQSIATRAQAAVVIYKVLEAIGGF